MINIVILANGSGERFRQVGYTMPKPLIKVLGHSLLRMTASSIQPSSDDVVHVVYRSGFERYDLQSVLKHQLPHLNFQFLPLNLATANPVETFKAWLDHNPKLEGPCLLLDCDMIYDPSILKNFRTRSIDTVFWMTKSEPIFSYIKTQGTTVIDIAEKTVISDKACCGAYGFEDLKILREYLDVSRMVYISQIYGDFLETKRPVHAENATGTICLGTPLQLLAFANSQGVLEPRRFCFDLDNTLVTYPIIRGDYSSVEPKQYNIDLVKQLYANGHTIIIHTARRMATHKGNTGKVVADIGQVTMQTLERFDIPYHELYFGKPYADFYIDDLAVSTAEDFEKSTGFVLRTPSRRTNHIRVFDDVVIKTSDNDDFAGELYWYDNIPSSCRDLFPGVKAVSQQELIIEKIIGVDYAQLLRMRLLQPSHILLLLESLDRLHNSMVAPDLPDIYANYAKKLRRRKIQNISEYTKILYNIERYESVNGAIPGVIHGDPVFSNVLMTSDSQIKFIDMRGCLGDNLTIFGDRLYDYGKVYQSLLGYDYIMAGLSPDFDYLKTLSEPFWDHARIQLGVIADWIPCVTNSLIISLLPYHDNALQSGYLSLLAK